MGRKAFFNEKEQRKRIGAKEKAICNGKRTKEIGKSHQREGEGGGKKSESGMQKGRKKFVKRPGEKTFSSKSRGKTFIPSLCGKERKVVDRGR